MKSIRFGSVVLVCLLAVIGTGVAASNETVTLYGTVIENEQFMDDNGVAYDVGFNDQGDALIENVGKKVKVVGKVIDTDGFLTIMVESFQVLGDQETEASG